MTDASYPDGSMDITTITSLPDELLVNILAELRLVSRHSLTLALRTCRRWHAAGRDLVWKQLVLDDSNTSAHKLLHCLNFPRTTFTPALASRVSSLTMLIRPSTASSDPRYSPSSKTLAQILPNLTSLTALSLTQVIYAGNPWDVAPVNATTIEDILESLPQSVKHLDIDIAPSPGQDCICQSIANALQRLHTLRISYPRICKKVFAQSSSARYITINLCRYDLEPFVRRCQMPVDRNRLGWDGRVRRAWEHSKDITASMTDALQGPDSVMTVYPNLREIRLIEPCRASDMASSACVKVWRFRRNGNRKAEPNEPSLLTDTYSIRRSAGSSHSLLDANWTRVLQHKANDGRSPQSNRVGTTLRTLLQGPCAWFEDEAGAKHPPEE